MGLFEPDDAEKQSTAFQPGLCEVCSKAAELAAAQEVRSTGAEEGGRGSQGGGVRGEEGGAGAQGWGAAAQGGDMEAQGGGMGAQGSASTGRGFDSTRDWAPTTDNSTGTGWQRVTRVGDWPPGERPYIGSCQLHRMV